MSAPAPAAASSSSPLQIYFCASIRGELVSKPFLNELIGHLKATHGPVLTEHIGWDSCEAVDQSNEGIYSRDVAWLQRSDIVIAECSSASLGVGYELAYAEARNKPILVLYRWPNDSGKHISAMISGNKTPGTDQTVQYYANKEEACAIMDDWIAAWRAKTGRVAGAPVAASAAAASSSAAAASSSATRGKPSVADAIVRVLGTAAFAGTEAAESGFDVANAVSALQPVMPATVAEVEDALAKLRFADAAGEWPMPDLEKCMFLQCLTEIAADHWTAAAGPALLGALFAHTPDPSAHAIQFDFCNTQLFDGFNAEAQLARLATFIATVIDRASSEEVERAPRLRRFLNELWETRRWGEEEAAKLLAACEAAKWNDSSRSNIWIVMLRDWATPQ